MSGFLTTIATHAVVFLAGAFGGAWAWDKYKGKAAATLDQAAKK